jgi:hypothetical protein
VISPIVLVTALWQIAVLAIGARLDGGSKEALRAAKRPLSST